ncbi:hypothetical protein GT022_19105 [Agaribacter marinus]|uniref:Core-binding (CB) domain-containing protein n=1 Tax=Virgibacillus salarius TaxID=447199 RepID=A0A941DZC7_9BACI|nr:hypothetical protein [Virgibacillus salarius]MBR7798132.1 hypothetical protein [Virgibacillus salarius]NAZ10841.1 hypothetical protein [Agaribacter marinus]
MSEPGGFRTKGKPRKSGRSVRNSSKDDLDYLFRIFYEIKVSEGRSARTLKQYDENFRFFMSYLESREIPKSIGKIVKFDGHEYKTVGLATSIINTRLKTLRVFFSTIQDEDYILGNPMKGVKNLKEDVTDIEVINTDVMRSLLAAPDQRYFPDSN